MGRAELSEVRLMRKNKEANFLPNFITKIFYYKGLAEQSQTLPSLLWNLNNLQN